MKPTVYVDSSIPSYWLEPETEDPILVARHLTTRRWWADLDNYSAFVSEVVLEELRAGRPERATARLELTKTIPLLEVTDVVAEAARFYAKHFAMPRKNMRDAFIWRWPRCTEWSIW